jgi:hypothetical protein
MKATRNLSSVFLACSSLILLCAACAPANSAPLAQFTENSVTVSIWLDKLDDGSYQLRAEFTPLAGFHLYSKDIPRAGVDGLGRPTLLELPSNAQMQAKGPLQESVQALVPSFEPKDLLVYPTGPVMLSLPVTLPDTHQFDDFVSVTYMACSETGCKPPVVDKLIPVEISGAK